TLRRNSQLDLSRQSFLTHLIPTLVKLALKLGDPFLGCVMRRVAKARGVVGEEWLVRRQRLLLPNPCDGGVGQGGVKVILWVVLGLDGLGAVEQGGMPLIGVSADEAVEVLEPQPGRPEIERSSLAGLPIGYIVILAVPGRVPAVLFESLSHRAATLRHHRVV